MTSLMAGSGRLNGQWPHGDKSQFIKLESDRREKEKEREEDREKE